tara:strand:+ start:6534 stop:7100 length:567 start_codon:yes stop_codon:yes gene_type:complete
MPEVGKHTTFGCNRLALWGSLSFMPTYYASNLDTIEEGLNLPNPRCKKRRFLIRPKDKQMPTEHVFQGRWSNVEKVPRMRFLCFKRRTQFVRSGYTMTFIMAQLAIAMRFDTLYFLGCDLRPGPHVFDMHEEERPEDFIETPKLDGWEELRDEAKSRGISLISCTPGGRINEALPYQELEEVLGAVPV